ncbi:MAG: biotin--[acetyl-CoA-carboxylase] ligase [Thermoplasmata archaeon]
MKIYKVDKTTTTNDLARTLCGGDEDFVVVAEEQTARKYTKNGEWISPLGGLYFTLCTKLEPVLPLKAAAAVAQTLDDLGGYPSIKWPHEVLVDGKILCGIFMETEGQNALLGMIINNEYAPSDKSTCIASAIGRSIRSKTLMDGILARFAAMDDVLNTYKQFSPIVGRHIVVKTPDGNLTGKVEDIGECGSLVLDKGRKLSPDDAVLLRSVNKPSNEGSS